jgi:hypothetical protein
MEATYNMPTKNLSTKGLTGLLGDMRKQNNFIVSIIDVTDSTEDGGNNLDLVIQQAFLPQISLNVLEFRHGNDAKKLAGVASFTGGTLTILDTLSRKELDALMAWFYQTYNPETGALGLASEYKKNGRIIEFASDGRYRRTWDVKGLFISQFNPGTLDASSGEMKQISVEIQIDPSSMVPTYEDEFDTNYND